MSAKSGEDVMATCNIILEPKRHGYNPRDDINGFVELSNVENIIFYGCKVVLEGVVAVKFKEGEVNHSRAQAVVKKYVFVGGDGRTKTTLIPPKTTYPFSVQLPYTTIPGSYKGTHGHIVYQIVVYLSNGLRWIRGGEKEFKVNSVLELPRPSHPLVYEKSMPILSQEKHRKGPFLKCILRSDQGPIVYDGKDFIFSIQVDNHNELPIKDIGVALFQYVTYNCGPNKVTKNVIATARAPIPTATLWKGSLSVPLKTRPTQTGLITIDYFIKVKMITEDHCSGNLLGETPITVCSKRILNLNFNTVAKSQSWCGSGTGTGTGTGSGTKRSGRGTLQALASSLQTTPQSPLSHQSPDTETSDTQKLINI